MCTGGRTADSSADSEPLQIGTGVGAACRRSLAVPRDCCCPVFANAQAVLVETADLIHRFAETRVGGLPMPLHRPGMVCWPNFAFLQEHGDIVGGDGDPCVSRLPVPLHCRSEEHTSE